MFILFPSQSLLGRSGLIGVWAWGPDPVGSLFQPLGLIDTRSYDTTSVYHVNTFLKGIRRTTLSGG